MGTWALPQTKKSAEQLAALMAKPLKANQAEDAIYNLLGDDELSDNICERPSRLRICRILALTAKSASKRRRAD